jgi:hypothetical protein
MLWVVAAILRSSGCAELWMFIGCWDVKIIVQQEMTVACLTASDHADRLRIEAMRWVESGVDQQQNKRLA